MRTVMALCVLTLLWVMGPVYARLAGTLTLEGYSDAFALCVEEGNDDIVLLDDLTIIVFNNYTLYINAGHEGDAELINLKVLATVECK